MNGEIAGGTFICGGILAGHTPFQAQSVSFFASAVEI
jgi:hypothetical protein